MGLPFEGATYAQSVLKSSNFNCRNDVVLSRSRRPRCCCYVRRWDSAGRSDVAMVSFRMIEGTCENASCGHRGVGDPMGPSAAAMQFRANLPVSCINFYALQGRGAAHGGVAGRVGRATGHFGPPAAR